MSYKRKVHNNEYKEIYINPYEEQSPSIREVDITSYSENSSSQNQTKEVNISEDYHHRVPRNGTCKGCGIDRVNLRVATNEYLCQDCRNNIHFKLITKTTALKKYTNITYKDLINNYKSKNIQCFFVKNWIDPKKDFIKLYYEKEIQKLNKQLNKPQTHSRSNPISH